MNENEYLYSLKSSLITPKEKEYLTAIKRSLPAGYFVQPQINLASIINKNDDQSFHNELFRNVDACIFDMTYRPIVLIEINDMSHNYNRRKSRDLKVKNICEEAGIKVITFWTKYGVNQEYISKTVNEAIINAPYFVRVKHSVDKNDISLDNRLDNGIEQSVVQQDVNKSKQNGCYIATAVYGSYDCSSVWVLRRFRDYRLAQNFFGRCFIQMYYFCSPHLVKWFGNKNWFKKFWKNILDEKVEKLKRQGFSDKPYNDLY